MRADLDIQVNKIIKKEMENLTLTDDSYMPYGKKFKGMKMIDIPAWYLLELIKYDDIPNNVKDYILDNENALLMEYNEDNER